MNIVGKSFLVVGLLVVCGGIAAQPALHFEALLTDAMLAESHGECPADLMAPNIKAACDEQMPALGSGRYAPMKPVNSTFFGLLRRLSSTSPLTA